MSVPTGPSSRLQISRASRRTQTTLATLQHWLNDNLAHISKKKAKVEELHTHPVSADVTLV